MHILRACLGLRLKGLKVLLTLKNSFFKKKKSFGKKIKSTFKGLKSLKMIKKTFLVKA
jgi:hypothetical protein